jgi:hypothetical protein
MAIRFGYANRGSIGAGKEGVAGSSPAEGLGNCFWLRAWETVSRSWQRGSGLLADEAESSEPHSC